MILHSYDVQRTSEKVIAREVLDRNGRLLFYPEKFKI